MARDKLGKFLWYKLLVKFCFGPRSFHEPRTWRLLATQDWGAKSWLTLLPVDKHTKPSGRGTTLSKTHDMPKKSRAAREQPDKLFAILAEHTEFAELMRILRSITTNIHKRLSRARKPSIMPKFVRLSQGQLDSMVKTCWWSLFFSLDSFMFKVKTLCYMRDSPSTPMCHPSSTTSLTS